MEFFLSSAVGYLIGSIPFAFLILKRKGMDITSQGSGNVGAMNSYEVTNSKATGLLVLLLDFAKGSASVLAAKLFSGDFFIYPAIALIFTVLSHNYNPWLKFKGGRGLASAAGGAVFIFPFMLIVWLIMYGIAYAMKKNIHFGNIWGTIFTLIIIFLSADAATNYSYPKAGKNELMLFSASILILIFIKHIEPLLNLIENKEFKKE